LPGCGDLELLGMVFKPTSGFPIVLIMDHNAGGTEKNQDGENKKEGQRPE